MPSPMIFVQMGQDVREIVLRTELLSVLGNEVTKEIRQVEHIPGVLCGAPESELSAEQIRRLDDVIGGFLEYALHVEIAATRLRNLAKQAVKAYELPRVESAIG